MKQTLKLFRFLVFVIGVFVVAESKVVKAEDSTSCNPNYAGACVPIASDVDCSSSNSNGPAYVVGPVKVIGRDIYGLDRDHDGIGCEQG